MKDKKSCCPHCKRGKPCLEKSGRNKVKIRKEDLTKKALRIAVRLFEKVSTKVPGKPGKWKLGGEEGCWRTGKSGQRAFYRDNEKGECNPSGKPPIGVPDKFKDAVAGLDTATKKTPQKPVKKPVKKAVKKTVKKKKEPESLPVEPDKVSSAGGVGSLDSPKKISISPKEALKKSFDYLDDMEERAIGAVSEDDLQKKMTAFYKNSSDKRAMLNLKSFTGADYIAIRKAQNDPEGAKGTNAARQAKSIEAFLEKAPKAPGIVYRGMNVTQDVADKILSQQFMDLGGSMSSASRDPKVAEGFTVGKKEVKMIFEIDQASGVDITPLSLFKNEKETLISSKARFMISGVQYRMNTGTYHVELMEIEPSLIP